MVGCGEGCALGRGAGERAQHQQPAKGLQPRGTRGRAASGREGSGSSGQEKPERVEEDAPGLPWSRCVTLGHPEFRAWRLPALRETRRARLSLYTNVCFCCVGKR